MTPLALLATNLFDNATITASSAASGLPASNLQQADVARKWRGTGGASETITATWPSDQTADTFALAGVGDKAQAVTAANRFLATGTVRLQLTTNGGTTGDVYNGSATAGVVDPKYGYAIQLPGSYTFRSAKWTLAQAAATYIEAGAGIVGVRQTFGYNAALGMGRTFVDPSTKKKTDGGVTKIRLRPQYRTLSFDMQYVTEAEANSIIEEIDFANGARRNILVLTNPESTNLGRDSIWGLIDKIEQVLTPGGYDLTGGLRKSRAYLVEERG
jgi:hypothetical protein